MMADRSHAPKQKNTQVYLLSGSVSLVACRHGPQPHEVNTPDVPNHETLTADAEAEKQFSAP